MIKELSDFFWLKGTGKQTRCESVKTQSISELYMGETSGSLIYLTEL